jgi:hypothetical protein
VKHAVFHRQVFLSANQNRKGKSAMTKSKASKPKSSTSRSGGVNIGGGSKVNIKGDFVGRDKVTTTTTGMKGDEIARLFEPVLKTVTAQAPADKRIEAEAKVAELQQQAQSKAPNIGVVGKALKWLKQNVPGASSALNTVLNQPIIGQGIKDIAAVILENGD